MHNPLNSVNYKVTECSLFHSLLSIIRLILREDECSRLWMYQKWVFPHLICISSTIEFHDCLWWYKSSKRYFSSQLASCLCLRSLTLGASFLLKKPVGEHLGRRQCNCVMKGFCPLHFSHSQCDTKRMIPTKIK